MKKVSVIGAGSWGSALAVLLANNGHEVTLWTHDPHEIEMLSTKREQVEKLPGVKLPDNISTIQIICSSNPPTTYWSMFILIKIR